MNPIEMSPDFSDTFLAKGGRHESGDDSDEQFGAGEIGFDVSDDCMRT